MNVVFDFCKFGKLSIVVSEFFKIEVGLLNFCECVGD